MIDPQAQDILNELQRRQSALPEPRDAAEKLAQARAMTDGIADFAGPPVDLTEIDDVHVAGPAGPIPVRLYRPDAQGTLPLLVWFHGGGAIAGSVETHDVPLRALARASGFAIASVGYRLAPEHPFPAPLADCLAALDALAETAGERGFDPSRIAVGGDSIGGLFAARAAIVARNERTPTLIASIHLYPNTDLSPDRRFASLDTEEGHVMTRASLAFEADCFVPDAALRETPDVSPLLEPNLADLCPALVVTCEHDPLRDEGAAYADRLEAAGVPLTRLFLPGMIHAVFQFGGRTDAAEDLIAQVAAFLKSR